tara:strand:+ start:1270 stop:1944 length:675 start_codon:yes stop_codon:yes gene_type:complete
LVKSLIIVGASSEFSNTFISHVKNSFEIYLISRKETDSIDINNQLLVDDYLNDIDKIKNFIKNIKEANVIFFNGFLAENRKSYYPTNNEIRKTMEINYLIPYVLTNELYQSCLIEKFIYISSMSAIKPRYKNYIYGLSKRNLEKSIKNIEGIKYLFIRFGQIETRMSVSHKKAPFKLSKEKASINLLKLLPSNGIKYGSAGLLFMSWLIKFLPLRIINYIEERE